MSFKFTALPVVPTSKDIPKEVYTELQTVYRALRELETEVQELKAQIIELQQVGS